jgi:hypothetical protein
MPAGLREDSCEWHREPSGSVVGEPGVAMQVYEIIPKRIWKGMKPLQEDTTLDRETESFANLTARWDMPNDSYRRKK